MPTPSLLTTETGIIITTESGQGILVDLPTNNADIQSFDFSVDVLKALLWQYNKAENLESLLTKKQAWYDANQEQFWTDWLTNVFDLRTANDFGLAVWSIILNLPLFVTNPPDSLSKPTFGFNDPFYKNFNRGNFSNFRGSATSLSQPVKRLALRLRYFCLQSSGTVPEINRFLKQVFAGFGACYLLDGLNMTQRYIFQFPLTSELKYLFDNFDVLPRPAGVGSGYYDATKKYFGFGEFRLNFNRGNFQG